MLRKRGFTLIELLVVIAIIAVLMGVLMPALQKVKQQGYQVVCKSNMKQIGLAANLYAQDNKFKIPRALVNKTAPAWFEYFMPYLAQKATSGDYRNVKIYRCKAYPNKQQTVCYVINGWGFNGQTDMQGFEQGTPTNINAIKRAQETIYLTDYEYIDEKKTPIITQANQDDIITCDIRGVGDLAYDLTGKLNDPRRVPLNRHAKGSNILYMDGSVDHLRAEEITIEKFRTH